MPKVGHLDLLEHSSPCLLVENYSNQFENQTRQFAPCNTHGASFKSEALVHRKKIVWFEKIKLNFNVLPKVRARNH